MLGKPTASRLNYNFNGLLSLRPCASTICPLSDAQQTWRWDCLTSHVDPEQTNRPPVAIVSN
jgi:hypothetical protein